AGRLSGARAARASVTGAGSELVRRLAGPPARRTGRLAALAALAIAASSVACLPGGLVPPTPTDAPPLLLVPTSTASSVLPGRSVPRLSIGPPPPPVASPIVATTAPATPAPFGRDATEVPATTRTVTATPTAPAAPSPAPTTSPTLPTKTLTVTRSPRPSATAVPPARAPATPSPVSGYPLPASAPIPTPAPAVGYPSPTR
ncbi:MAG: hypothetical protein ACRDIY_19070, partial [Chloroflexota bacterium]